RRVKIASGYLKEMAAEWYRRIRKNIEFWKFAPEESQHRWQMELYELQQKDIEKVDIYTTKFQKLLNQVNVNNGFSKDFIIRMFLKGLKGKNAELVNIAAPKNLDDGIAAAKRIETGIYGKEARIPIHPDENSELFAERSSNDSSN
ncbi:19763_t:CDS:2, partial [Gigaspora rosea]